MDPAARKLPFCAKLLFLVDLATCFRVLRFGIVPTFRDLKEYCDLASPFRRLPPSHLPGIKNLVKQYCVGKGLEIGPGNFPYCDQTRTTFMDKFPNSRLGMPVHKIEDAHQIPARDQLYQFVFTSHVLEHLVDPLRALKEWLRVLQPGGALFLVLPHPERTFDKGRPLTSLTHLISDFDRKVSAEDPSHRWDGASDEEWKDCVGQGTFHYHVWTQSEVVELLLYLDCHIVFAAEEVADRIDSFVVVAKKRSALGPS